jgi:hypothetical protein
MLSVGHPSSTLTFKEFPMKRLCLELCLLAIAATPARGDGFDNNFALSVIAADTYGVRQEQTSGSEAAVLSVSSQSQGVDLYGRSYLVSSKAQAAFNGFDLFASSSLIGGTTTLFDLGEAQAVAGANLAFLFVVPADVSFMSEQISADGHGPSRTGPNGSALGIAGVTLDSLPCILSLNGGMQTNSCGPIAVIPGGISNFSMAAALTESSFQPGDSAEQNYWGTFTAAIDYYDANGKQIGQYDFISPATSETPEPSSLVLVGTGLVCVVGAMRRRLHT